MNRSVISASFYETYYFASYVTNVLRDRFAHLRYLHDFYGEGAHLGLISPFSRYSAFHAFLNFIIEDAVTEDTEYWKLDIQQDLADQHRNNGIALLDIKPEVTPIEHALRVHGMNHISFVAWLARQQKTFETARKSDVGDYLEALRESGSVEELVEQSVKETFFLLFGNRQLLLLFNDMIADQVAKTKISELLEEDAELFAKDGVLKRKNIPKWVKRTVFYRDRGRCCSCRSDLTGTVNAWPEEHYDHMVPLIKGGLNDVSNIQLLCGSCNRKKSGGEAVTSSEYEDWYKMK